MMNIPVMIAASSIVVAEFGAFLIWLRHEPKHYEEDE